jgi:hypothetical protein
MKTILILITAALFMASCNSADKNADGTSKNDTTQYTKDSLAKIQREVDENGFSSYTSIQWIDSTYIDLGKLKKGGEVEVSFRFRNTGDKPLVISNVTAGCGCTVPEKPEKPYAPGEEGVIKAKFDSKSQSVGEQRKHVTVTANTTPASVHTLNFRVEVTE